ncbi:MAG: dipeptide epimerase [Candidatus Methanofastidiosa archaeon]|nr:dipeptide epimerase [Candidatus Methanofastidiosa archaeon]
MKIVDINFEKATFKFNRPMKVSFKEFKGFDTLILKMETDEGITGYGEAATLPFVTGDNIETALSIGKEFRDKLIGENPILIGNIHNIMDSMYAYNTSIKAGIDIACYDIAAKKMNTPLYKYLGGVNKVIHSDTTLGMDDPDTMAEKAVEWVQKGWRKLKVKLGEDISLDLKRMKSIRKAVGNGITLRIDANQGWSVKDSIRIINELEVLDIELIEQPIIYWDYDGLYEIKSSVNIPIVADESCHSPIDAAKLVKAKAVNGINIKLMKCGGIYKALKINSIAEANNIFCMLGCMGESKIANSAAMHFGIANNNVKMYDLDTTFFTKSTFIKGGFTNKGSACYITENAGLGITIDGM